jgi:hypothetical protein
MSKKGGEEFEKEKKEERRMRMRRNIVEGTEQGKEGGGEEGR